MQNEQLMTLKHAYEAINNRAVPIEKPGPHKKQKSLKDKTHLQWVASQPCIITGCQNRSNVHHVRIMGEPRDDRKTIPLCYEHHQCGPDGLHFMGKHAWRKKFGHELTMLDELMKRTVK